MASTHEAPAVVALNIDYLDVEKFIAVKISGGLSPKKVRDAVSVVSLVMKCALRTNARRDNPASGHQIRVLKRKLRPGDAPDMADIERLVAHVRGPYKPAVWLLAYTGMRPSELCGLTVRSIDFTRRRVRISETLLPVHRFAGLPYTLAGGPPKTDAGDRDIPIPAWLCDDLAAILARTRRWSAQRRGARRFLVRPADRAAAQPGQVPTGHRPAGPARRRLARITSHLRHPAQSCQPLDRAGSKCPGHRPAHGPHRPSCHAAGLGPPVHGRAGGPDTAPR